MAIKIYSSLSGKKENLPNTRPLRLFVCGPTVYDNPHLGHGRTYIAFDTIVRYLRSKKINVFYLQNITDVDDKIIERAKEKHISPLELANKFEKEYYKIEKILNIKSVKHAKASKHIPQIIKQIQTLIKKGCAYKINDGYYFDISTFPEYGKLSKRTASQAEDATSRIDNDINKKNKGDFALWKFSKTQISAPPERASLPPLARLATGGAFGGDINADLHRKKNSMKIINYEPVWYTSLGWGRPGWHIEDTAISEHYFGSQYDIHGGGVDLKFPHHEAEITQQESASGKKPMVKIWMHTGFLLIDGKKMSKSLKNFTTIKDFTKKYSPEILRLLINLNHYRSSFNYTEKSAEQGINTLKKLQKIITSLSFIKEKGIVSSEIEYLLKKAENNFDIAMSDDFNTPKAIASIFELINTIEPKIWTLSKNEATIIKKFIIKKLSIFLGTTLKTHKIPKNITILAQERELCRGNKQFTKSDLLRNKIKSLGYIIEDTIIGPLISKD
ncbi:cysteine--tRNA ligase [Patescibacteria group bacterium]|nr:cysteine--tRNA ligase [Patescibacteria group bacterium]